MENKNIFIEHHEVIDAIMEHEAECDNYGIALSMFTANARNCEYPDRPMYGDEDTIKNTDWAAIGQVIADADSAQLAAWTREFNEALQ